MNRHDVALAVWFGFRWMTYAFGLIYWVKLIVALWP